MGISTASAQVALARTCVLNAAASAPLAGRLTAAANFAPLSGSSRERSVASSLASQPLMARLLRWRCYEGRL